MALNKWSLFGNPKRLAAHSQLRRRHCLVPRVETLESRLLLTRIMVNTAEDIVDGNYDSIAELIADPGDDGHISLREAVLASNRTQDGPINSSAGFDRIDFDPSLNGVPITLSIEGRGEDAGFTGDLDITGGLIIVGNSSLVDGVLRPETIIDAGGIDRIFDIRKKPEDVDVFVNVSITRVQLTGGHTESDGLEGSGGAIRNQIPRGPGMNINSSVIFGNSTSGDDAKGGAVFSDESVNFLDSVISENFTTGEGADGGAIWSSKKVYLNQSTISGNFTTGDGARGGGIFVQGEVVSYGIFGERFNGGEAKLTESTVSGNSTAGARASGGGIFAEALVLLASSVVSGNSTAGEDATGGGIYSPGDVLLTGSTVSDNATAGDFASGGGISTGGNVRLSAELDFPGVEIIGIKDVYAGNTVSGNSTAGNFAPGGGIFSQGDVRLVGSTISGNSTSGLSSNGGGILARDFIRLTGSTVTGNNTAGDESNGGGISTTENVTLISAIVAANTASQGPDLFTPSPLLAKYSLIGDNRNTSLFEAQTTDFNHNLIGSSSGSGTIDPLLGPLADNGGPTLTHGLLPGSPAIDAGSNPDDAEPFDQRGESDFDRLIGDYPDMGAFEGTVDPSPTSLPGDANRDGRFNTDDLLLLLSAQKFNSEEQATWEQGDWNDDGRFNVDDLLLALAEDNFNAAVAATEAIDHYHFQEETSNKRPLDTEPIQIDSNVLLAGQRRNRTR